MKRLKKSLILLVMIMVALLFSGIIAPAAAKQKRLPTVPKVPGADKGKARAKPFTYLPPVFL